MDPEHHRKRPFDRPLGDNDIEKETILFAGFGVMTVPIAEIGLRTGCTKLRSLANIAPSSPGHRIVPTQIPDRRLGIGNAEEFGTASGARDSMKLTRCGGNDQCILRRLGRTFPW